MKSKVFIIFLFVVLLISACGKSSDKDQSLTSKEYADIGLPDPSKIWSYDDYFEACDILDYLKTNKPLSLPRKDSKRSSTYFNRIINPDNLSFLQNDTIPLNEKAYQIQKYLDIYELLLSAYTNLSSTDEQYYNRELIEIYLFGLTIAQDMLDLGQSINESVVERDIGMQHGFSSIQHMYVSMILFVLNIQNKAGVFEEADLEKLTEYMSNSISLNKDWMDSTELEDLKLGIREVMDNTASDAILNEYGNLIETL